MTGYLARAGQPKEAAAVWVPLQPTIDVETELPDYDEYEVRIYDAVKGRHLVAAIEIVSPPNKDRPGHRNVFVGKCAAVIQKGVAVSLYLVPARHFNLYTDLLAFIDHSDPTFGEVPPDLSTASCPGSARGKGPHYKRGRTPLPSGTRCPLCRCGWGGFVRPSRTGTERPTGV